MCHFGGHRNASGAIQGSPLQDGQRADLRECTEAYERGPIRPDWQCGGQGFESPKLHPADLAVSLHGRRPALPGANRKGQPRAVP
jgi:hypothetical protein